MSYTKFKQGITPYLYLLPIVILSMMLIYYCIGFTVYSSFTSWDGMGSDFDWIGLKNYSKMFGDKTFYIAIRNNLIFFVATIFIQAVIGMFLAVLLKYKLPGSNMFKAIFFLPIAMAPSIIAAIFKIILNPTFGELNEFLRMVGLDFMAIGWLGDRHFALIAIIIVNIFQWMGFSMMTYYAGLMSIPEEVYEAAKIDGAGFFRILFSITVPMLKRTSNVLVILGIVGSLKTFDIVKLLTDGGPGRSTTFLNTFLYEKAFNDFNAGGAASIGVMILIIALIMSFIQMGIAGGEHND